MMGVFMELRKIERQEKEIFDHCAILKFAVQPEWALSSSMKGAFIVQNEKEKLTASPARMET
jgi:hypothetical protein